MTRTLRHLVATAQVHSTRHSAAPFLNHLHALRPTSLIVDCGDFFEGSGYYRLAHGGIERENATGPVALYCGKYQSATGPQPPGYWRDLAKVRAVAS
jgi:hypothetical protein